MVHSFSVRSSDKFQSKNFFLNKKKKKKSVAITSSFMCHNVCCTHTVQLHVDSWPYHTTTFAASSRLTHRSFRARGSRPNQSFPPLRNVPVHLYLPGNGNLFLATLCSSTRYDAAQESQPKSG
ncbi:unnamed protein product [Ixodes pacificus]